MTKSVKFDNDLVSESVTAEAGFKTLSSPDAKIGREFIGNWELLWALKTSDLDFLLGTNIEHLDREYLIEATSSDPWIQNIILNHWEFKNGKTVLQTYPWMITVPIVDLCNARCTFCNSWLTGRDMTTLEKLENFETLFRFARYVGLVGHGEPLLHPDIDKILEKIGDWLDPRAKCYTITNGVFIGDQIENLIRGKVKSVHVSLNAATGDTHQVVMGLNKGAFEQVLNSVRALIKKRDAGELDAVTISLVVLQQNIHEISKFIRLGNDLNVDYIQLKTLSGERSTTQGALNYHTLPPYIHEDYLQLKHTAETAIANSDVRVLVDIDSWNTPVFTREAQKKLEKSQPAYISRREALKSKKYRSKLNHSHTDVNSLPGKGQFIDYIDNFDGDNPFGRLPRYFCNFPYQYLNINDFSDDMYPCCYINKVPGYEKVRYTSDEEFFDAWNSPAFVELRRRLKDGPLFNACSKCPSQKAIEGWAIN